jgi:DNA repair photolyase
MQNREPNLIPTIYRLNRLDYWYWSSYFIDFFEECPYRCSYCHTRKRGNLRGLRTVRQLPEERTVVGLGLFSDAFHPDSRWNKSVRSTLDTLVRGRAGITIQTKSISVADHADLLRRAQDRVRVTFTVISPRHDLTAKLEGRSPSTQERFAAMARLRTGNIPAGIAISPIMPGINDDERDLTGLIDAAADAGAGWVLFSGFQPTTGFFLDPRWEKSRKLHRDAQKLAESYRRAKEILLDAAGRSGLPIRMPRILLNALAGRYGSAAVSEHLFTLSYMHELVGNDMEAMRFRRAAYVIDAMGGSLKSVVFRRDLGYIRGINPVIEAVVEEFIEGGRSSALDSLERELSPAASA